MGASDGIRTGPREWVCSRCGRSTRRGRTPWAGRLSLCGRCVNVESQTQLDVFDPPQITCCESARATGGAYHRAGCGAT